VVTVNLGGVLLQQSDSEIHQRHHLSNLTEAAATEKEETDPFDCSTGTYSVGQYRAVKLCIPQKGEQEEQ
jgi:hypothetical protein